MLAELRSEQYGYTLRKALAAHGMDIDEGTLYPLLRRLETQGLLVSQWREEDKRRKRFYQLSGDGALILQQLSTEWRAMNASLDKILRSTVMELLDRYLTFIRFWLPRGKQQDIIAELSEDLHAQIADQEAALGRALNEAELEAVLKQLRASAPGGGPLPGAATAHRPALLSAVLVRAEDGAVGAVPAALVLGAIWLLFRVHPIGALIGSVGDAIAGAIYMVGLLTLVFVVLERLQTKLTFLEDWRPRDLPKLPVVPDPIQIPRSESFGSFVGLLVFTLWWVDALAIPPIPHVHFLQPLPQAFFWPVLVVVVAEMALHVINLFMPWWTRRRAALRLVLDLASLGLLGAMLLSWPWFGLQIDQLAPAGLAKLAPADVARIDQIVNLSLLVCLAGVGLSYALRAVQDTLRTLGRPPLQTLLLSMFTR